MRDLGMVSSNVMWCVSVVCVLLCNPNGDPCVSTDLLSFVSWKVMREKD